MHCLADVLANRLWADLHNLGARIMASWKFDTLISFASPGEGAAGCAAHAAARFSTEGRKERLICALARCTTPQHDTCLPNHLVPGGWSTCGRRVRACCRTHACYSTDGAYAGTPQPSRRRHCCSREGRRRHAVHVPQGRKAEAALYSAQECLCEGTCHGDLCTHARPLADIASPMPLGQRHDRTLRTPGFCRHSL